MIAPFGPTDEIVGKLNPLKCCQLNTNAVTEESSGSQLLETIKIDIRITNRFLTTFANK